MQKLPDFLPATEAEETLVKKISGYIESSLTHARNETQEEWDFVPVSRRAHELASIIFMTFANELRNTP